VSSTLQLGRRSLADLVREPGGVLPELITPTFLYLAVAWMFGGLAELPGFGAVDYVSFLLALGILQAAGLVGAAAGVPVARDVQTKFFDRLLVAPTSRYGLLVATGAAAAARALLSVLAVLLVGLLLGAEVSGPGGLLVAVLLTLWFAGVTAGWGLVVALRTGSPGAAPLMQAPVILFLSLAPAFAPRELLAGWLRPVVAANPLTWVLEAVQAPFTGGASWPTTWPGLVALAGLTALFYGLAAGQLHRWEA
jgi:ABC-2 type transport system permease protein